MKLFITTMGIPGAGKSHFSKHIAPKIGAVRLNSDSMRNSVFDDPTAIDSTFGNIVVFNAIDYAASEVLRAGYSVVYDAKVNHRNERDKNASIAAKFDATYLNVWVQTPKEIAMERGEKRELRLDQTHISKEDYELRGYGDIDSPEDDELVVVIDGTRPFEEQYESFKQQLETLGIK